MKNKHIGIITFSNTLDNYGQVLQYLATQEYLESRGHYAFLYKPLGSSGTTYSKIKHKLRRALKKVLRLFWYNRVVKKNLYLSKRQEGEPSDAQKQKVFEQWAEITQKYEELHPRHFEQFRQKHFHILSCYYEDVKDVYAFAVGSDQMWSYLSQDTLLDFPYGWIKRFSIAPSVGHKIFNQHELEIAAPSLAKFDFITVREQNGIDFCKACGRKDAQLVLDPTFLISPTIYQKYADIQDYHLPQRYVMLYLLGGEISPTVNEIFKWARNCELKVVYVASQGREDDFPKCYATIEQWLYVLQNAEYVFTNSYHGMAMSIIYRKQFLTFPLTGIMTGMNSRIFHLAEQFKLQKRIYSGDLNIVEESVNWQYADKMIVENRNKLEKLLKTIDL